VERDPYAPFSTYRTYAWLPPLGGVEADLFGERARHEIDIQLVGKGYLPAGDGRPDLMVQTEVVVVERNADTIGDFIRYGEAGGTKDLFTAFAAGYEEATLTVMVFDAAGRQRIWRGRTPVALDAKHRVDRAAAGIDEMFKTFPPIGGVIAQ